MDERLRGVSPLNPLNPSTHSSLGGKSHVASDSKAEWLCRHLPDQGRMKPAATVREQSAQALRVKEQAE